NLIQHLKRRAACAGLVVCGRVPASVRGLSAEEPELREITVTSEDAFVGACRASQSLRAMLRFALSDEYLAAQREAQEDLEST
ncbi:MAG: hypothetical protein KC416_17660, partial [Myxococcales bacterium]|nr:hypothetical protein [Myxococcales bacterium]